VSSFSWVTALIPAGVAEGLVIIWLLGIVLFAITTVIAGRRDPWVMIIIDIQPFMGLLLLSLNIVGWPAMVAWKLMQHGDQ
jgi:hypothetical protein